MQRKLDAEHRWERKKELEKNHIVKHKVCIFMVEIWLKLRQVTGS